MEKLIDRVWEYSQNNPEGFTLDLETMTPVKFGIVVAFLETQNHFGKESLRDVLKHASDNCKVIGGWQNEKNGMYYFDSCRVFKNSELDKALEFAKENEQLAIFDLTNLRVIETGG